MGRRVIEIFADSANNRNNSPMETARDEVTAVGITIDRLAVLCRSRSGRPIGYDLNAAFAERVIGGPDAFVITAERAATLSTPEAS